MESDRIKTRKEKNKEAARKYRAKKRLGRFSGAEVYSISEVPKDEFDMDIE